MNVEIDIWNIFWAGVGFGIVVGSGLVISILEYRLYRYKKELKNKRK